MDFTILAKLLVFCLTVVINGVSGWFWQARREVCYGDLGCFYSNYPYSNAGGMLPRDPDYLDTRLLLYTRHNQSGEEIRLNGSYGDWCMWAAMCETQSVKVIIHGYMHSVDEDWVTNMTQELLIQDNHSVILVDYRIAAREISYLQSVANARLVGKQIAAVLKIAHEYHNINLANMHLIGHSLGSHVAGFAGKALKGIGRITGLDPAGPAFEGTDQRVRLDKSDAKLVDVIHTDAEVFGLGIRQAVGTLDFYPNGGKDQPGCPLSYLDHITLLWNGDFDMINNIGCSHLRAIDMFTASINSNCNRRAYPCTKIDYASSRKCNRCKGRSCAVLGYRATRDMKPGKYYTKTAPEPPFCAM